MKSFLKPTKIGKNSCVSRCVAEMMNFRKSTTTRASRCVGRLMKPTLSTTAAFSLVEMLMALLVASLLMVAIAPVMTKKFNETVTLNDTVELNPSRVFCGYVNDGASEISIDETNATVCKVPPETFYMNAIIASGGGGGAGATGQIVGTERITGGSINGSVQTSALEYSFSSANYCSAVGNTSEAKNQTFNITNDMSDIIIELYGGGAAGGGGNSNEKGYPANQNDCGDWGVYIAPQYTESSGHGICVSKYNVGEESSVGIARTGSPGIRNIGITAVNIGESTSGTSDCDLEKSNCCWVTNGISGTKTASECDSRNGSYSGCYRAACQWNAAYKACNNYQPVSGGSKGRLPKAAEIRDWSDNRFSTDIGRGNSGLQLCYYEVNEVGTQCKSGILDARYLWGAEEYTTTWSGQTAPAGQIHHAVNCHWAFNSGAGYYSSAIYSARCVVDKISTFQGYYGAAGQNAPYAKVRIPESILKRARENKDSSGKVYPITLTLYAGSGGKGGTARIHRTGDGIGCHNQYGGRSQAKLKQNGTTLWIFEVRQGNQGQNGGINGNAPINAFLDINSEIPLFEYYNKYSNSTTFNNSSAYVTYSVLKTELGDDFIDADSGTSSFNYGNAGKTPHLGGNGAKGGDPNGDLNGQDATSPGAGGGGGVCIEGTTRLSPVCGHGGNGAPGRVSFSYIRTIPGVGGGGGGAGSLLHLRNVPVRPNDIIKVKVGHGGAGGTISNSGKDGGTSEITLASGAKYTVLGGKGGQKATTGNANTPTVVYSTPGIGGAGGDVDNSTKSAMKSSDKLYPASTNDKAAQKGQDAPNGNNPSENLAFGYIAAGGNGEINVKTSFARGISTNRIPCGGFSSTNFTLNGETYECTSDTPVHTPLPLQRALIQNDFRGSDITNYILGSTGGGGGGWDNRGGSGYTNTAASGGSGMGGYVYIYFTGW